MAHPILLLLLILPSTLRITVTATCFYPNGAIEPSHQPCSSPAGTSICCAAGFECLSNGLCNDVRYENFTRVLRGACTDENWGLEACGAVCKDAWPDRDEAVYYCGEGKWCCDGFECCEEGKGIVELGVPEVVGVANANASDATSTISSTLNPTPSNTAPVNTNTAPAHSSNKNNTLAIGVGVGVGVGVLLLVVAIIAYCIIRRRRRNRKMTPQELADTQIHHLGNTTGGDEYKPELKGDAPHCEELSASAEPREMYVWPQGEAPGVSKF